MWFFRYAFLIACLVAPGACTASGPPAPVRPPATERSPSSSPALPDSWRWESYRGVQVAVPDNWGWGSGTQRLGQWCINEKSTKPIVGRPGISTLVGCIAKAEGPPAETLIINTGWIVAFAPYASGDGSPNPIARGGDRRVVRAGDVWVIVQAPPALRERIARTVHEVDVDDAGCLVTDPVSMHPEGRPRPPADVASLTGVTSVSVCKYEIVQEGEPRGGATLLSSLRYRDEPAAKLTRQIATAPEGGGPDNPKQCSLGYGSDMIVLHIWSSAGETQVHVRYSGCDHHGFDDGSSVRTLTRAPMQALVRGPNALSSYESGLAHLLESSG